MNEQAWTLVGVVIGGLLAVGGNLVGDVFRARREESRALHTVRLTAYSDVLTAISEFTAPHDGGTETWQQLSSRWTPSVARALERI